MPSRTLTFALKNKAPNDLVPVVPGILTLTVKNKSLVLLPDIQGMNSLSIHMAILSDKIHTFVL